MISNHANRRSDARIIFNEQNVFSPPGAPALLNMAQFQRFLEAGRGQAGASCMLGTICSCTMQQLSKPPRQLDHPTHSMKVLAEVTGAPITQKVQPCLCEGMWQWL